MALSIVAPEVYFCSVAKIEPKNTLSEYVLYSIKFSNPLFKIFFSGNHLCYLELYEKLCYHFDQPSIYSLLGDLMNLFSFLFRGKI